MAALPLTQKGVDINLPAETKTNDRRHARRQPDRAQLHAPTRRIVDQQPGRDAARSSRSRLRNIFEQRKDKTMFIIGGRHAPLQGHRRRHRRRERRRRRKGRHRHRRHAESRRRGQWQQLVSSRQSSTSHSILNGRPSRGGLFFLRRSLMGRFRKVAGRCVPAARLPDVPPLVREQHREHCPEPPGDPRRRPEIGAGRGEIDPVGG